MTYNNAPIVCIPELDLRCPVCRTTHEPIDANAVRRSDGFQCDRCSALSGFAFDREGNPVALRRRGPNSRPIWGEIHVSTSVAVGASR